MANKSLKARKSTRLARPTPGATSRGRTGKPNAQTKVPSTAGVSRADINARPSGKLGQILNAAAGKGGTTLPELATLTGWLPHTVRAALSRLRQRGFHIQLSNIDGRKAYRLPQEGPR